MFVAYPRRVARTQRERSETTRTELLDAARQLFAADGYEMTSLVGVAAAAGVTKGGLYHHFGGKRELFCAVFEREQERLAEIVLAGFRRESDPWGGFYAGCRAFYEAVLDPAVQRIVLLDASAALGSELMRSIEGRYSLALIGSGLNSAITEGRIAARPVAPLAHLLFGGMCEAAMMAARAGDPVRATKEVLTELKIQLDALALS